MAALRPGQAQTSAAGAAIGTVEVAEPLGDSRVFVHIDPASFRTGNAQRDMAVRSERLLEAGRYRGAAGRYLDMTVKVRYVRT